MTLNDYEVLGVGSLRRVGLQSLVGRGSLQVHPSLVPASQRGIYQAILKETLTWLKPQKIVEEKISGDPQEFVLNLLQAEFQKSFRQTAIALKKQSTALVQDYVNEFPWQGPLVSDHFRYFGGYLKTRIHDPGLYVMAQKEWLWSYLSFADFGRIQADPGHVTVNSSLQTLYVPVEVAEVSLTPGFYIYYYDERGGQVREYKMDVEDAAVVDMLQDDRKYTLDQLLDQLMISDLNLRASRKEWQKRILFLRAQGIISESGSEKL
jgi:hypothetical protein